MINPGNSTSTALHAPRTRGGGAYSFVACKSYDPCKGRNRKNRRIHKSARDTQQKPNISLHQVHTKHARSNANHLGIGNIEIRFQRVSEDKRARRYHERRWTIRCAAVAFWNKTPNDDMVPHYTFTSFDGPSSGLFFPPLWTAAFGMPSLFCDVLDVTLLLGGDKRGGANVNNFIHLKIYIRIAGYTSVKWQAFGYLGGHQAVSGVIVARAKAKLTGTRFFLGGGGGT